jgi:hypothetical protein
MVRALARHVAAGPPGDLPPVVLGDFNAEPASDEMSVTRVGLFATRGWSGPDGEVWPSDHAGVVVDLHAGR